MRGDEGTLFLADFQALKAATGDSPQFLDENWQESSDLQLLCDRLAQLRFTFEIAEEWTAIAFTPHVPAIAARARRDYDNRWKSVVADVANRELTLLLERLLGEQSQDNEVDDDVGDTLARDIESWKKSGKEEAQNIVQAFSHIAELQEHDPDLDLHEPLESWSRLNKSVGLDLQGAFWRRRALPHVLFPTHVSRHYGQRKASIFRRLFNAGRAFIFGAPLAALAMQRAVLEELLERHWGAPKGHIRDANLPSLSDDARADRLKNLANEALHGDPERLSADELDREIVKNFLLLRELIEAAPDGPRS